MLSRIGTTASSHRGSNVEQALSTLLDTVHVAVKLSYDVLMHV